MRMSRTSSARFGKDVLDAYLFGSLRELGQIIEPGIEEHTAVHPHEAGRHISPHQFAARISCPLQLSTGSGNAALTLILCHPESQTVAVQPIGHCRAPLLRPSNATLLL